MIAGRCSFWYGCRSGSVGWRDLDVDVRCGGSCVETRVSTCGCGRASEDVEVFVLKYMCGGWLGCECGDMLSVC